VCQRLKGAAGFTAAPRGCATMTPGWAA